jgi:hypothetical protein
MASIILHTASSRLRARDMYRNCTHSPRFKGMHPVCHLLARCPMQLPAEATLDRNIHLCLYVTPGYKVRRNV